MKSAKARALQRFRNRLAKNRGLSDYAKDWSAFGFINGYSACLRAMRSDYFRLLTAVRLTLREQSHLADGDNCTLWRLKQAMRQRRKRKR